jgi:hypothetical protein
MDQVPVFHDAGASGGRWICAPDAVARACAASTSSAVSTSNAMCSTPTSQ